MGIVLTLGECTTHVLYLEIAGVEGGLAGMECTLPAPDGAEMTQATPAEISIVVTEEGRSAHPFGALGDSAVPASVGGEARSYHKQPRGQAVLRQTPSLAPQHRHVQELR